MPRHRNFVSQRASCVLVVSVLVALGSVACGGRASEPLAGDDPVAPGSGCGEPGSTKLADDGCDLCTCTDAGWACDDAECPIAECAEGDQKPSADGCNTCSCQDGAWLCSQMPCEPPSCAEGDQKPSADGCNTCSCQDGAWLCSQMPCEPPSCEEGETMDDGCNTCSCQDGQWSCTLIYCPPACTEGTVKAAGDGCNTCACQEGEWSCTEAACDEPHCPVPEELPDQNCQGYELFGRLVGTDACCALCYALPEYRYYESMEACAASQVCTPGEVKYADDECNTCECAADGTWACTNADCEPTYCGGLGGSSCGEDEFCAYEANWGGCGVADQNAICRPRPTSCDGDYDPVCGCDGQTYSNACVANAAGMGLMTDAPCEPLD